MRMFVRALSLLLILVGTVIAFYPAFTDIYSWWIQNRLKSVLATGESSAQARAVGSNSKYDQESNLDYSLLEIPRINLSAVVLEGTQAEDLSKGPGRFLESALPGEGNTAIAGHRTMYGGWFRNLHRLKPGDRISLKSQGRTYYYKVERTFTVLDDDTSVVSPCGYRALTLVTCSGSRKAEERLAVRAKLVEVSPKQ